MSDKQAAKERTEMLKRLREQHQAAVAQTQALLKEQQAIRKQIRQAMAGGPKTLPEVAQASGLPTDQLLWHITAMKKYDLVVEIGKFGENYQYQLAEEIAR
jgi:predicted transcriptional regulator